MADHKNATACSVADPEGSQDAALRVEECLYSTRIWTEDDQAALHRTSGEALELPERFVSSIRELGEAIWSFYKALNRLWFSKEHEWVRGWLDVGKPDWLLDFARMNYSKQHLPRLLRPDLIYAHDQLWVTELDSVPGGAGQTAAMSRALSQAGEDVIGGPDGIVRGFAATLRDLGEKPDPVVAIVVSDESESYRREMEHLALRLHDEGLQAWCIHPRDLIFDEEGVYVQPNGSRQRLDVVWRFFELFDLKNIAKHELLMYAAKKRLVVVSPPYKPHLEEKLGLALLRHPALEEFWQAQMGDLFEVLWKAVPQTWVLDPSTVPPHAEISGLRFRNRPVRDFRVLADGSQKERRMVIKHSGFSPLAWGSRSVVVGHDTSQENWARALDDALASFSTTPHILQEFQEGRRIETHYLDPRTGKSGEMMGRARLSPYYYVADDKPMLSGILATICSADKKIIHGMADAVMTVCRGGTSANVQDG